MARSRASRHRLASSAPPESATTAPERTDVAGSTRSPPWIQEGRFRKNSATLVSQGPVSSAALGEEQQREAAADEHDDVEPGGGASSVT